MGQFTDIVDRHIPFNVSVVSQPGSYCDLLEVEVLVIQNITGEDLEYRWRVMDGELVQLECNDFYDLYYRCDAPRCLDLRVMTHDYAGRTLSECLGHVCIQ